MSNSPSARRSEVTDEQLGAELKNWTGASPALHPVGELLDRHWEAVIAYARLCAHGERAAGMLTTAAFTRLFGETLRQNGPTAAWRPHLLVTVRRIVAEWDADGRRDLLHPDLRAADGDTDRMAARLLPPVNRRLLSRAFQRLPQTARCLLWHIEVETEPLAVPAGLLGMEDEGARVELRRARERLREECLQLHRELAVDEECHRYHRLLDATCRRIGVDVDPDLRAHLDQCRHCAHTADQLNQFDAHFGVALAEGVLGWNAAAYMAVRAAGTAPSADASADAPAGGGGAVPGEAFTDETSVPDASVPAGTRSAAPDPLPAAGPRTRRGVRPRTAPHHASGTARHGAPGTAPRTAPRPGPEDAEPHAGPATPGPSSATPGPSPATREPDLDAAEPHPDNSGARSATGARPVSRRAAQKAARRVRRRNVAAAVLTVSGLIVAPLVLWSVLGSGDGADPATGDAARRTPGPTTDTAGPSWTGAGSETQGTLRGRLHNVASGLCVGIAGGKAVQGAEAQLATCSSAAGQQWSYETDGLLRSAEEPGLCADSRLGYSVRLAPCTEGGTYVRYDFTLQGTLVPRGSQDLALAPAATDGSGAVVLKNRDEGAAQRWVIDTSQPDPQLQFVNWGADATAESTPAPASGSAQPTTATPAPQPSATSTATPSPSATSSAPGTDTSSCAPGSSSSCAWDGEPDSPGGSGDGDGGRGSDGGEGSGGGRR
ncbi:ricin-type beta-trefoil lectin domain protein [Streptomyces sp. NPDC003247]|uniref:ricin-type beta-trefoil lectin domain protein n=1 Tax=Streptomyces sp. NPDC003247 TaxID=3364677 RepID=UPI00367C8FEE